MTGAPVLVTRRMRLVASTADRVRAEIGDRVEFGRLLEATIPIDWPPDEAADALPWFLERLKAADPRDAGFYGFYGVVVTGEADAPILVGGGGCLGPPVEGVAEIGYSVLPAFQQRGYAGEMMRAILDWIEADPRIRRVTAETDHDNLASHRLLARLGFVEVEAGGDEPRTTYEKHSDSATREPA